ncbi:lipase maturation factor family protein [Brevibacterium sp. JSBI002]|uniref:lipase maturation factor family protein n=1 Tax=Brevibacterium sp. JSBI002 TaxID=2886045 RepID=UPI00222E98BC|nr:lipase maturation factor family protein [Brevibacterium sp. JSBI002]UZD62544.1 lipase maturation factor family protein [Brevibacterium sp. JSBI002]
MDLSQVVALLTAGDYTISREIIQRGIALLFLIAFASAFNQFPALLGERGLTPAPRFIALTSALQAPTIFRWKRFSYSDRRLRLVCVVGMVLAASAIIGLPQAGPAWVPIPVFSAMWALYFSIVSIGQRFYGFGWESLLLEAGFLIGFLGSHEVAPTWPMILLLRWFVIRIEFGAGMIKMRGDSSWRDLTAMDYHHQTQPMPNPLSRRAHLMPGWWHKAETLGSHIVQLAAPWLLFLPQPIASFAAVAIIITQLALVISGNYAWLNWATILLACSGISDTFFRWIVGGPFPGWGWNSVTSKFADPTGTEVDNPAAVAHPVEALPVWWLIIVLVFVVWQAWLNVPALRNFFSPNQLMNASFNRLGLGNAYGAFGSMTETRNEIVVEGWDGERWREYEFKGKPGDLLRRGPVVAPYHLRLDWLMWFAALGDYRQTWFTELLHAIGSGDPQIRRLMGPDPFDGAAPELIRVRVFTYRYATRAERAAAKAASEPKPWWVRSDPRILIRPIDLRQG